MAAQLSGFSGNKEGSYISWEFQSKTNDYRLTIQPCASIQISIVVTTRDRLSAILNAFASNANTLWMNLH